MKGMILAAGYGARLRPTTEKIPKPLFAIGETSMVKNAICYLAQNGIKDIAINLYHLAHMIKEELASISDSRIMLHLIEEKELMGTAGGIKGAESFLKGSEFVVINSDILIDLDLEMAIDFHRKNGGLATLVLRDNHDPATTGTLKLDSNGRLAQFLASRSPNCDPSRIPDTPKMFTGLQIFSPEIFRHIPAGRPVNISKEVYPALIESGADIFGYNYDGYWADIGTPESYAAAKADVAHGRFHPYS